MDAPIPDPLSKGRELRLIRYTRGGGLRSKAPRIDERRNGDVERAAGSLADLARHREDLEQFIADGERLGAHVPIEVGQLRGRIEGRHEAIHLVEPGLDDSSHPVGLPGTELAVDLHAERRAHRLTGKLVHRRSRPGADPPDGQRAEQHERQRQGYPGSAVEPGPVAEHAIRSRSHRTVRWRGRRPGRPASFGRPRSSRGGRRGSTPHLRARDGAVSNWHTAPGG